jgi:NAD-dependent deacetylase
MTLGSDRFVELGKVVDVLRDVERLAVLSGAGISAAAKIPIYRGPDGEFLDPETEKWLQCETFEADPRAWYEKFWGFHEQIRDAQPTLGHMALKAMAEAGVVSDVVTQNVDALDLRAGTDEENVFEVHGVERQLSCIGCDATFETEPWLERNGAANPARCERDGGVLKPDFNLYHDQYIRGYVNDNAQRGVLALDEADGLLVVGTSLHIWPWNQMVVDAWRAKKPIVIINPHPTEFDGAARGLVIRATADEGLQMLREELVGG